jgi:hypothetical protein
MDVIVQYKTHNVWYRKDNFILYLESHQILNK